jgi:hypothetical protein
MEKKRAPRFIHSTLLSSHDSPLPRAHLKFSIVALNDE